MAFLRGVLFERLKDPYRTLVTAYTTSLIDHFWNQD